jgi:hypothetical protein
MAAVHTCVCQTKEATSVCVPLVLGFMQTGIAHSFSYLNQLQLFVLLLGFNFSHSPSMLLLLSISWMTGHAVQAVKSQFTMQH